MAPHNLVPVGDWTRGRHDLSRLRWQHLEPPPGDRQLRIVHAEEGLQTLRREMLVLWKGIERQDIQLSGACPEHHKVDQEDQHRNRIRK